MSTSTERAALGVLQNQDEETCSLCLNCLCWQLRLVSLMVYVRKVVRVSEVRSCRDIRVRAGLCRQ